MIKTLKFLLGNIRMTFSPPYIYTLDKDRSKKGSNQWYFKEFGTHTYVIKTWEQMLCSNFLSKLNPADISYISCVEAHKTMMCSNYQISEVKRGGEYILKNQINNDIIRVLDHDFIRNRELISRTEPFDILQIAYNAGLMRGKKLASSTVRQEVNEKRTPPLRIVR